MDTRGSLYDPSHEHDSCGVGLIVNIKGAKYHDVVENALQVLEHMAHRGAEGADNKTGDGAGIMIQIPHEFILLNGIPVPERGRYGVGMLFMPKDMLDYETFINIIRETISEEGLTLTHLRDVPVNSSVLGHDAAMCEPQIKQMFICGKEDIGIDVKRYEEHLQSRLYVVGKKIERRIMESSIKDKDNCYIVSLSTRTLIYKGMLTSRQLRYYYPDLMNPYFTSAVALVHSRFSTNTFPMWRLAQPFRFIAHNGEINTIKGNRLWMQTRESILKPYNLGKIEEISPIIQEGMSDSASLDNTVEFFVKSGMSLPHTLAMLIPESYGEKDLLSNRIKSFYEYHSIFMEPWDGPAAVMFSDGHYAGGLLDRNGLRPARYAITKNGMLVLASETGVLDIDPSIITEKGRLQPGKMLLVDLDDGRIISNNEIKSTLAEEHPYREWLQKNLVVLNDIHSGRKLKHSIDHYQERLHTFGIGKEDIELILKPMVNTHQEPTMSMGADIPIAILSKRPQRFFDYFRQMFAQVTNPAIDPLREYSVMSLTDYIGGVSGNILEATPEMCKVVELPSPIISNTNLDNLKNLTYKGFRTITLNMVFAASKGVVGMQQAIDNLCLEVEQTVDKGYNYIILSDKAINDTYAPIPSLIVMSAVHHHLIKSKKRSQTAIIIESGEVMQVMDVALLTGYGASAVNPYMAFAILNELVSHQELQLDYATAKRYYIQAIDKGLMKIISKMGISTIRSYRGSMLFESIGISSSLLEKYFGGGISKIEGITLEDVAQDTLLRHTKGFSKTDTQVPNLEDFGRYRYRKDGERHAWYPQIITTLQKAVRENDYDQYKLFSAMADNTEQPIFIRNLMELCSDRTPISIDDVESENEIVKHFVGGAISFGAISREAHEDIALAMNFLGCRSNTGEGGEDSKRFYEKRNGIALRSATKQVASGRFGVTTEYLVDADEIQIKVAQGAKPGEGGQLPGFKVDEMIAKTRHSIPGITLISPPPHHDIYSIEDLSQLIFDLKNVNPRATISVKLVAESGVGTIAAGVAKAKADTILISGADGGTGASPASSIHYAGLPMELGLAEIQQTLIFNNLRGKVKIQCDGGLKNGRDVIISTLLGAEEYGFSTALMISLGCIMDRKCHTNTCPVGIATQCAELRVKYKGHYQYVVNYLLFVAREVREYLAQMGYHSLCEIIGRCDLLSQKHNEGRMSKIDLSKILHKIKNKDKPIKWQGKYQTLPSGLKDESLITASEHAIKSRLPMQFISPIANTDRSVGAMLSGYITKSCTDNSLPDNTITINFRGSAGQSFGAFLCKGVTFRLEGDSNDYLGKGLSGGHIIVVPPVEVNYSPETNIIAGNTILYGATSGEVYIRGRVGERFCVRNSGAVAVVEGVGDHCCEYMTGGRTVVLGPTGRNFAAGMSGGIAYVWDPEHNLDFNCNMDSVELTLVENAADRSELHCYIEAHYEHTKSRLASSMLRNWVKYSSEFIKVMPIEYKKIIENK